MTPTVLVDYGPQRQIKRSYDEISYRGVVATAPRGYAETVGESGSPVRVDSEDSSAPKRKCISLNSDGFEVKRDTFVPAKLSSSERRYLRKRFRTELDSVRDLLKKPEFMAIVPVNRGPAFSSSAAPRPKKVQRGHHVIRGAKGRFLPTKPKPEASTVLPEATVLKQCEAILKKLMTQKFSHIFNVPVDVEKLNIPDYNDIIKHPMDLGTIKKKLDSGSYTSPSDFAADVRLTFNNAITYNPRGHAVHDMAIQLNKMFESRWKTVEKKLASATAKPHVEVARADSKRRKTPPVDRSDLSMECVRPTEIMKPKMTDEEKTSFGNCLASLSEGGEDLPDHIINLLQQCIPNNTDEHGNGEIEIDIHALSDDVLLELKKHVDKYMQEKDHQHTNSEPSENEAVGVSGLSHSSTDPCKGGEPVEEDVDICGNTSPILIEKDPQIRTSKLGSPSSSSSDSGSSSSDSDSGSDTESESEKVGSPANLAKGVMVSEQPAEQEKSDVISPIDPIQNAADVEPREQYNESNAAPEGESAKPDNQVSPDKLLRAALLRSRYADVIVKARGVLSQGEGGDTQEELEKLQKEEKARLLAEGNAAMEARRAEAEAESKRKRDLEREKARQALQEMERTVEINDNVHPKDLEMLGTATTEHIVSSVDETSPAHSQDGMPSFLPGSSSMLEKLGLFMKVDDEEEEEEEEPSVPSSKDGEEGEEEPSVLCSKDGEEGEEVPSVLRGNAEEEGEKEPSVICGKDREEGEEEPSVFCSKDGEDGGEPSVLCSKDGEEGEEEPSVLCSKHGEEGEEEPSALCSKDGEEGEEGSSVPICKDGEEGEEGPSVPICKDGEEGEEEPSVLCSKHGEEGEEEPSALCSKDGEEGEEGPSVPICKDGEEGEKEPNVLCGKHGEEGEEEPSALCSKDGEEGGPSVPICKDGEEGEKEPSVLCGKDGEEGEEPSIPICKDGEEGEMN